MSPSRVTPARTRFDFKLFERMMSLLNTPLKRLPVTGGPCMARVEYVSKRWRLALFAGLVSLLADMALAGTNSAGSESVGCPPLTGGVRAGDRGPQ